MVDRRPDTATADKWPDTAMVDRQPDTATADRWPGIATAGMWPDTAMVDRWPGIATVGTWPDTATAGIAPLARTTLRLGSTLAPTGCRMVAPRKWVNSSAGTQPVRCWTRVARAAVSVTFARRPRPHRRCCTMRFRASLP